MPGRSQAVACQGANPDVACPKLVSSPRVKHWSGCHMPRIWSVCRMLKRVGSPFVAFPKLVRWSRFKFFVRKSYAKNLVGMSCAKKLVQTSRVKN